MRKQLAFSLFACALAGCVPSAAQYAHEQAVALCGMIPHKPAAVYYLECEEQHKTFPELASCGRETRNAGCAAQNSCHAGGNAIIEYADSLAARVDSGETSEKEAFIQWQAYKKENNWPETAQAAYSALDAANEKGRACYQRSYPQFLATEVGRRSAIDAATANSGPVFTTCSGGTGSVNCTSW